MAGKIFINYRRDDEAASAGRLFDRLSAAFKPDQLFMDVDNIAPGHDFVRVLEEQVGLCDVILVMIGRQWSMVRDEAGRFRLNNPNDFVRIEIESAIKLGKRIIPVLINNAQMPRPEDLPEGLRPLTRRNAVRLAHERFHADAQGLVKILETALAEEQAARHAAGRKAKVANARDREPGGWSRTPWPLRATALGGIAGAFAGAALFVAWPVDTPLVSRGADKLPRAAPFAEKAGYSLKGRPLGPQPLPSVDTIERCREMCRALPQCKAFDFSTSRACFHYASVQGEWSLTGWWSGVRNSP